MATEKNMTNKGGRWQRRKINKQTNKRRNVAIETNMTNVTNKGVRWQRRKILQTKTECGNRNKYDKCDKQKCKVATEKNMTKKGVRWL